MRIFIYAILFALFVALFLVASRLSRLVRIERLLRSEDPSLTEDLEKAIFGLLTERQNLKSRLDSITKILEKLPVGVVIFNKDLRITYTNRSANRFFLAGSESGGKSKVFVPIEKSLELASLVKKAIEQGERSFEVRDKDTKKSFKITIHFIEPSPESQERVPIAIIEDITIKNRLEDLKKYLVSDLSHQLKTPIASMKIALEALEDYELLTDPERGRKLVKNLKQDVERVNELVEKILLLSRIESTSKSELKLERVGLRDLVDEALKRLENQASEKKIRFVVKGRDVEITADRSLLVEALTNLIENAVKFSSAESPVIIETGESQGSAFVRVTNFGSFIDAEEIPFIFQRFYRSKKQRIQSREGFGLGLSLAKNIVEVHEGHIEVSSSKERGTTFSVFLAVRSF